MDLGLPTLTTPVRSTTPPVLGVPGGSNGARAQQAPGQEKPEPTDAVSAAGEPLSKEQQAKIRELKKRDAEVKAHEQAHASVGGAYASAPKYTYTRGPDGKKYAVGGEVEIDVSPERTPEATIRKMDIVIRAALAPAEPSSQDRAVARQAQQQRLEAQNALAQQEASSEASGASAKSSSGDAGAMDTGLLAQILAQSADRPTAPNLTTHPPGQAAAFRAAASAYDAAASLAASVFGG